MHSVIASSQHNVIIGMGVTGLSVARFLARTHAVFSVFDSRQSPPQLEAFKKEFPDVKVQVGEFDGEQLQAFDRIILSPGVARVTPAIAQAIAAGVEVIGDIELFARNAKAPIVAITGSNGKTTVTSLVGEMAKAAGKRVGVGGNLGTPALDLLDENAELYVLELSSFQLESTPQLNAEVACILNLSADHLDRYPSMQHYWQAKQKIFWGAKKIVANRDDALTQAPMAVAKPYCTFGSSKPDFNQYGLIGQGEDLAIAKGLDQLIALREMKLRGRHNALNAQAALAIGSYAGLPLDVMLQTLKTFKGLPHRCEFVATIGGVDFYNDSKGTNVGATVAAVEGLAHDKNIVLIAGGEGKGATFEELAAVAQKHIKALITIGVDGHKIAAVCASACDVHFAENLQQAVLVANQVKQSGDVVLMSPACASFDLFKNYEDRGNQFKQHVEALCV